MIDKDIENLASVLQEFFPNGGRDYESAEDLAKAIIDGLIPNLFYKN